jgi:exodeoxyribonuclease VII small subunit
MSKTIHFEQSLSELERIVKQLEQGDLSLEESLKQFESGISIARHCQKTLEQAEQKIELLMQKNTDSDAGESDE